MMRRLLGRPARAGAKVAGLALLALIGYLRGAGRRGRRIVVAAPGRTGVETAVGLLLLASAASAVVFMLAYILDWPNLTQWLGLSLGVALGLLAAALVALGRSALAEEQLSDAYPDAGGDPEAQSQVAQILSESGDGITRKRFLAGSAAAAVTALGAALITPAASMGPFLETAAMRRSPWSRGRHLVDVAGERIAAEHVESGTFYTAYPEGADRAQLGAPLIVVRLDPGAIDPESERADWAFEGIVAYSKICTHAGCAVSMFRNPKFEPTQPERALVCPCHYSTFDPAEGGKVVFGPAGRELPQLPLDVDEAGDLVSAGDLSAAVGPSFWSDESKPEGRGA